MGRAQRLLVRGTVLTASVMAMALFHVPNASAAADTCTWTGAANSSMINSGNWAGCDNGTVPDAGDTLVFPTGVSNQNVTNDLPALSLAALTFQDESYIITGGSFSLTSGITVSNATGINSITSDITFTGGSPMAITVASDLSLGGDLSFGAAGVAANVATGASVDVDGVVSGTGPITKTGAGTLALFGVNTYTGTTTVSAGLLVSDSSGLGAVSAGTTVASGGSLLFSSVGDVTTAEPLTLNGPGTGADQTLINNLFDGDTLTLSGAITLGSADVIIASYTPMVVSGVVSGSGGFTYEDLSGDDSAVLTLSATNTYTGATTIDGITIVSGDISSSAITVPSGATLKGEGDVGAVSVALGGHVAPGNSPGCLTSGNLTMVSGSSLDVEIAGTTPCTQYDRLNVTGTVTLGGATLNVGLLSGFVPAVGNTFTIIDNDGTADAVTGTFTGLAQGASLTVGGVTYSVSYTGGDGNDVVLTVTAVTATPTPPTPAPPAPRVPSAGVKALSNSPLTGLAVVLMASAIGYLARKQVLGQRTNSN